MHTLRALYLVTYGTKDEADRAGEAVRLVHEKVHGRIDAPLGRFPAGTPYSASDPELQLWVHATLVALSLAVYERFVEPLTSDEEERYYREMALVARLFGTPASALPSSLASFRDYFEGELRGTTITVTPPAREVARVILGAQLPPVMRVLRPAHRLATAGLLPARLRTEYGLRWTPVHEAALPFAARSVKVMTTPVLMAASRLTPLPTELAA